MSIITLTACLVFLFFFANLHCMTTSEGFVFIHVGVDFRNLAESRAAGSGEMTGSSRCIFAQARSAAATLRAAPAK